MKTTKTFYFCNEDNYGQRIGTYTTLELTAEQVEERNDLFYYKGRFLYESFEQVLRACQD